jgi:hypothetical protein
MSEGELDRQLRALFADDRLDLPVAPDAVRSVVSGARRRRVRRQAMVASGGAAAVAAVVLGGIVLAGGFGRHPATQATQPGLTISATAADISDTADTSVSTTQASTAGSPSRESTGATEPRTTTTQPTTTTPPPSVTTTEPGPPASWPKTIGPNGYGLLRLGMTEQQALTTGYLAQDDRHPGDCAYYEHFNGMSDYADASFGSAGLVQIAPPERIGVQTPEGVGVGSTLGQLRAAYPQLTGSDSQYETPAPGGAANARYYFELTAANVVHEVLLALPGC